MTSTSTSAALSRRALLLSPAALALLRAVPAGAVAPPPGLSRGLSASFWFEWAPGDAAAVRRHLETKYRASDWPVIRKMGFDHIRVPVQPDFLSPRLGRGDSTPNPQRLELFDSALQGITAAGLGVVIDCHPASPVKTKMARDSAYFGLIESWWNGLAAHAVRQPYNRKDGLFFELLNEPEEAFDDTARYRSLMEQLVGTVRRAAPETTLLVGGNRWNVPEALYDGLKTPLQDRNIVYVFHFYQPMAFTHQGLENAGAYYGKLRSVPWNFDAGTVSEAAIAQSDPSVADSLRRYAAKPNRENDLEWWFKSVRTWCDEHDVRAWMGEFGVYKIKAPAPDRAAWIAAARRQAERHGFGWNMWEALGGFGMFSRSPDGALVADETVVAALGVNPPRNPGP